MSKVIKNPNCSTCDGGCCRIFVLPNKKLRSLTETKFFGKMFWMNLYSFIFSKIFLVKIKDKEASDYCSKSIYNDSWGGVSEPVSCRLIGDKGCKAYWLRPFYCAGYDCRNRPQIWHDLQHRRGLPLPPHIEKYYERMKMAIESENKRKDYQWSSTPFSIPTSTAGVCSTPFTEP